MSVAIKKKSDKVKSLDPIIPDKLYFRIGEVAEICKLPTYVLRFWETEFPQLKPGKSGTGQRMYRRRDVENVLRIRKLLYEDGFTISGARQQIRVEAKATSKVQAPLPFPRRQSCELKRVRQGLREILGMLSARR
jgi:DNA-binding transcriptional MerR regulator